MAYLRYTLVPRLFASNLESQNNRLVFGSTYTSDDINDNMNDNYKRGWEIIGNDDYPSLQDFNSFFYTQSNLISYLYQSGIPEWGETVPYVMYSIVGYKGEIYTSTTGSDASPNIGNNPSLDTTNWERMYDASAGAQAIETKSTIAFSTIHSPQFTLPATTTVKKIINYNSKPIDVGNCFDTATGTFTCTKAGYYKFGATVSVGGTADTTVDDSMRWLLILNGSSVFYTMDNPAYNTYTPKKQLITLSYLLHLSVGDTIAFGYKDTWRNTTIYNLSFNGYLL